ncbi:MAG: ParB N-terminal domain-containing protein [Burkholderiales bacterium]|nr:ParB N-terminal domain-containing protein [Burkholderiales bacterium]
MEHTKELLSVPLSALVASPFNVRRYASGQVEELAALIHSQGLIHNLVVTEHIGRRGKKKSAGNGELRFAVAAGERRRRALLLLQSRGRLPTDYQVPCELVPPERALEVSIAENSGREPLHPADEFDAFKAMIAEGKGIEDVAARFGVSPLTVQRRLKLAALSPRLLALYRQDGINLDQLMALTLADDHAVQEANWFDVPHWEQGVAAIRRRLTAGEVEAMRCGLARFVGIETYEAAGGVFSRDLFDSEHSRFLADPALLQRLALEKLETTVTAVRDEGWAWVEARLEVDALALRQFARADYDLRKPTADEREELAELARRSRELELQSDGLRDRPEGWPDEAELIDLEEQDIAARQRAIQQGLQVWTLEVKALAGVIVTVSREGDVAIIRGLVREADRKAVDAARRRREKAACEAVGPRRGDATAATTDESESTGSSRATPAESKRPEFSDALSRRLAAHRTLALQAVLARNVPVALVALANALAQRVLGDEYRRAGHALQITAQPSALALAAAADDAKAAPAWLALQTARDAWIERLPRDRTAWFAWLLELPQAEPLELLALCSALTANALPAAGTACDANALVNVVGLDMADWWEPTEEGFLNHVSKAQIVQALKEAGAILGTDRVESMKKDLLVSTALARLKGKRWLPAPLRPPSV